MASLSRKFLTSLGIEEDKADLIMERHSEVLTEIKEERDKYKEEAEAVPSLQKQLEDLKELEEKAEKDPYKVKYEALKEDYEEYKGKIEKQETASKRKNAYVKLLKDAGIAEKRIDAILRVTDLENLELDEDGNPKEAEKLTADIKDEWADFIVKTSNEGIKTPKPPMSDGKTTTKTKEEIRAINDPIARQKAMLENPSLFGLPDTSNN